MRRHIGLALCMWAACAGLVVAQRQRVRHQEEMEFGPVVRAYLGYLRDEQEVVDDRVSRREISPVYYRHNSNRIRALRQMATHIARTTNNDYIPELEAVSSYEFGDLFDNSPRPEALRVGEVLNNTFRFLGAVRSGEVFYIFERLDPYEQAELMNKEKAQSGPAAATAASSVSAAAKGLPAPVPHPSPVGASARPRRAGGP